MWARQLLRRIEGPMHKFEQNKSIMGTKQSRSIVRQYNRVARALIEFSALWEQAWLKSVDSVWQGLNATLLVRHPETAQPIVNFDKDIAKLVKEARCMRRMGIPIPSVAQMVLLQEEKFSYYFQQLTHIVKEHARIMGSIKTIVKPLLKPHIDDLEKKIAPGLSVICWTSLNVDGFIHLLTQALDRFEELVLKVNDVLAHRVEHNLHTIAHTLLVSLPPDQSFSYEEFATQQAKFVAKQGKAIAVRNAEVRRTIQELVALINAAPRENPGVQIDRDDAANFNDHYYLGMYDAVAQASKNSFQVCCYTMRIFCHHGDLSAARELLCASWFELVCKLVSCSGAMLHWQLLCSWCDSQVTQSVCWSAGAETAAEPRRHVQWRRCRQALL